MPYLTPSWMTTRIGRSIANLTGSKAFFDPLDPPLGYIRAALTASASTFSSAIRLASMASIAADAVASSLRCDSRLSVSFSATSFAAAAAGTVSITRVNSTPYTCVHPSRSFRSFSLRFSFSDNRRSRPDIDPDPPAPSSSDPIAPPSFSISAISLKVFLRSSRTTRLSRLIVSTRRVWLSNTRSMYAEFLGTAA